MPNNLNRFWLSFVHEISSINATQIKRVIRKKHTLPAYKMRVKPFFTGINYTPGVVDPRRSCRTATEQEQLTQQQRQSISLHLMSCSRLVIDITDCILGVFAVVTLGEWYTYVLPLLD